MSINRLCVRISNCSRDLRSMCGLRNTVYRSMRVGSGIGPFTTAPVRLAVSTISWAVRSSTSWSNASIRMRIRSLVKPAKAVSRSPRQLHPKRFYSLSGSVNVGIVLASVKWGKTISLPLVASRVGAPDAERVGDAVDVVEPRRDERDLQDAHVVEADGPQSVEILGHHLVGG